VDNRSLNGLCHYGKSCIVIRNDNFVRHNAEKCCIVIRNDNFVRHNAKMGFVIRKVVMSDDEITYSVMPDKINVS
jgi:hypothetical protein